MRKAREAAIHDVQDVADEHALKGWVKENGTVGRGRNQRKDAHRSMRVRDEQPRSTTAARGQAAPQWRASGCNAARSGP